MKRFLLWLVGVVLGVGIFLGAVMGVSYAFTTEGGCPDSTAQFGTEALEPNGWCWQVPLIGGKLDKVFASPATLTVQKLGTLYTAHPAITLPDWASYTTLTIQNAYGSIVFVGSVSDYQAFCSRLTANIRQSYRSGGCRRAAWPPNLRAAAPAQCAEIWGWKSLQSPPAGIVMPSGSPCRPARRWNFPPSGWSRAALWACASPA